jgi:hypothetical protein
MQINDKSINLTPGMEVTAEIRTGGAASQDIFSTHLRRQRESLRER